MPSTSGLPSWDSLQSDSDDGHWPENPVTPPPEPAAAPAPPKPSRRLLWAAIVLPLLTGVGGYLLGTSGSTPEDPPQKDKFAGTAVATLAESWLPDLGACLTARDPGGPMLDNGRVEAVTCQAGDVHVYFETFGTQQAFDDTRRYREQISRTSAGAMAPGPRTGPVSGVAGTYFEYVVDKTCGVFWGRAGALSDLRLETDCTAINGDWTVLRDLWARYS